jgi:xanthine dehydrogenase YagR molybdenum-binding subunit
MESAMDDLAVKLGMDPLEFRLKNDPNEVRQREYKIGAEKFGWKEKYQKPGSSPGVVKTGIGCAGAAWPAGGGQPPHAGRGADQSRRQRRIPSRRAGHRHRHQDGHRRRRRGNARTQAGADHRERRRHEFPARPRQRRQHHLCASISPTVYDICDKALQQLQTQSGIADARGDNWFAACKNSASPRWSFPESGSRGFRPPCLRRAVRRGRGGHRNRPGHGEKILGVHDCGLIINRNTLESQINGGIIMGMGYALYEERVMDDLSGVVLNPNFETYKMPGIADVPEIEIVLLNMPERGVIGIGEPATVPTAGAIANAVANAIGARVPACPSRPQKFWPRSAKCRRQPFRNHESL